MTVKDYKAFFYYSEQDKCYLAKIPDLPGCISDGQTPEEALANVRELGKDWLEIATEDGKEIPLPTCNPPEDAQRPNIYDVAVYILEKCGTITTKALQKLCYYCKAWSCAFWDTPIFPEEFEAWTGGPINRELWNKHSRLLMAKKEMFTSSQSKKLCKAETDLIDSVLAVYEDFDADSLGDLTHIESPWLEARGGLPKEAPCTNLILEESMRKYYGKAV